MCRMTLDIILLMLKQSTHNVRKISQIFAHTITTGLVNTTTLTLNSIIRAYSKSPTPLEATFIYNYFLKSSNISPDNYTYTPLLQACTRLSSLLKGKQVHAHVTKMGFLHSDIYIQNSLIKLYGSMTKIKDARQLFDEMSQRDLVSWNSILVSYSTSCDSRFEALLLFKEMMVSGVGVDAITMVILLSVCAQIGGRAYGRAIHGYIIKVGIQCGLNLENSLLGLYSKSGNMDMALRLFHEMVEQRDDVSYTILINGYVELGLVDQARMIFDQMVVKDIITWNSIINGYVKVKRYKEALELFEKMEMDIVSPDETTIVSVLSACAGLSDLKLGRLVHWFILQGNIKLDVFVGTALIDMYAKCGNLEDAMATFYKMGYRDVFTWTVAITGLADYGHGKEALILFEQMEKEGMRPNEATFVAILMACSRSGMVDEGCLLFDRMLEFYKIQPMIEHFGCLIDLLSRGGLLSQAEKFIETMPPDQRLIAYKTILSACISYFDIDFGAKVAKELIKLRPHGHEVYILLSNFYAMAGRWDKVVDMRRIMKELDMKKEAGISSIEIKPPLGG